jgi:hypothetical protein
MEIKKKIFLTFIKHWKMFDCTIFKKIIIIIFLFLTLKIILYSFFMMKSNLFLMNCIFLKKQIGLARSKKKHFNFEKIG